MHIILEDLQGVSKASIVDGELVSYVYHSTELMHQKGAPGWGNTEIEMFPIIGPVNETNFEVKTPKGAAKLDQHGILRVMPYELVSSSQTEAVYKKSYKANIEFVNPKYPKKSTLESLSWPYDFTFLKKFTLTEEGLQITFKIEAEDSMPYMLGFHPAFKIYDANVEIVNKDQSISLQEVMAVGSRALLVPQTNVLLINNNGKVPLKLSTEGFKHFMLWTEVDNMMCVEPITFYPYDVLQSELHNGFTTVETINTFKVTISPLV